MGLLRFPNSSLSPKALPFDVGRGKHDLGRESSMKLSGTSLVLYMEIKQLLYKCVQLYEGGTLVPMFRSVVKQRYQEYSRLEET